MGVSIAKLGYKPIFQHVQHPLTLWQKSINAVVYVIQIELL